MPIVQSVGTLQAFTNPPAPVSSSSVGSSGWGLQSAYAQIYATQPNVRICVDFLARNMAQLGLKVYRRVSDTDRQQLAYHQVARWLARPNPAKRRYRFMEDLMGDLGIYFNAFWFKVRGPVNGRSQVVGLVRLPPEEVTCTGGLLPRLYTWQSGSGSTDLDPNDLVVFNGYNPLDSRVGLSPLETLRQILEGEAAAAQNRAAYWLNASRMEGIIERPLTAPKWTPDQKKSWREQWQEKFAGVRNAGMVPVLEDGMTWKATSYSAKDSEYISARKLAREECASAYHIPLPMVGILDHATFSNIKEQHKQLYADTLGPWCVMIEDEVDGQLVPEADDHTDVYTEFNIAEKLKGSFEEQAAALGALVGRPVMTLNEGRARLNLPSMKDDPTADEVAAQQGGPAYHAPAVDDGTARGRVEVLAMEPPRGVERVVRAAWARQASRLGKVPSAVRAEQLDHRRCVRELAADLATWFGPQAATQYATRITTHTYALLRQGADAFHGNREVPPCPTVRQ
jgi:HK97 family phage portal protein